MSDSSYRDSHSQGRSSRRNEGFKKRNDRHSSYGRDYRDKNDDRNIGDYSNNRNSRGNYGEREYKENFRGFNDQNDRRSSGRDRRNSRGGDRAKNRHPSTNNRFANGGHQRGGQKRRNARENAAAMVAGKDNGYRPSKPKAPELDTDVTGKELNFSVQRELRTLEKDNAENVAKHLVMAGRYLDIDPQFALEHAKYAISRAGRISSVREAAGVTAYAAEDFEMALRELRTHRRISGSHEHLPLLIDSERALGRLDKALELAAESRELDLKPAERVEIALVVSGIEQDRGNLAAALTALEIPELNSKRGYGYSPRLFSAYADLLDDDGRGKEAVRWRRLARMTEAALGQGDFAEPEIFDIYGEAELFEDEPAVDLDENGGDDLEQATSQPVENQPDDRVVAGDTVSAENTATADSTIEKN